MGAGPAGYTAAIYAARAGLQPMIVAGMQPGGQLTITTEVENFPGFAAPIQGPWLMEQMREQAEHVGTRIQYDLITSVDLSRRPFRAVGDSGDIYEAEALVIATGAQARWLGIPGEKELSGFGVSACATCDGFFYRGKDVAVIGGGNSAVEEALYLANLAKSVTLIHRRDTLRAERILQKRLLAKENVTVRWNTVTEEVLAETTGRAPVARGLALRDVNTGERSELAVEGVFVAIGHSPATGLFKGQLDMDAEGYLVTEPDSTRTSVEGVFAAGDVQDRVFRQAVTAAGTGCMAALEAEKFLALSEDQSQAEAA
ncbi:thioredoxin-disulfide reductase [Pseudoroseomonas wenyumeiae]|uniref:Thioredoxin reductase n=1 Tax=Teichococcus wenyumeiae TaxID=2478470 RepID=A0A3A9JI71_9PROT|nr:thioredoxin-disulfide reductase [Pseudoroseomonas wenyumeiae]RKK04245.1 thioredoxin-disulfide reductase [Pseudoroseomonas wenyumeiae]RMI20428.1 thioredoxin-disulfide reductase [Pseudoroseomonas wenyumeiae]